MAYQLTVGFKLTTLVSLSLFLFACGGGDSNDDSGDGPGGDGNDSAPPVGLDARPDNMNCLAPASAGSTPDDLDLVDVFPNLDLSDAQFPLGMYQLPGNSDFFFVITRDGRVLRFDNDPSAMNVIEVLDISARVDDFNFEGGFLGLAFHPEVASNGAVYLSYTTGAGATAGTAPNRSVISRFTMIDESSIDPNSEQVVLSVNQPAGNHNGGDIHFGPDGYLYFGLGDGGGANDPNGNGQNTNTLLGSMLRIDVDPTTTSAPFYTIPADNPFVGGGGLAEIYAYGLRNPFRWSFDRVSGVLWAGDVGQGAREEVDHIVNGGNYGWDNMEGNICNVADCSGFVAPVHDYERDFGRSITGGYVYRGTDIPNLDGAYIFGDYVSRQIWTLTSEAGEFVRTDVVVAPSSGGIVSFAQDNAGEVYALLAFPDNGRSILKLQAPASTEPGSNIPALLSATGCFEPGNPAQADSGLIPYAVISPLWSDGAEKQRWMALPNGETIEVDEQGDFDFPTGTVLAKHFMNAGTLIETRLLMLHENGWAGYSYKWRDDQSDADLLQGANDDTVAGLDWHFPSGAECLQCHTSVKDFALGPEILQLNNDFTYPQSGRTANQVHTLDEIGLLSAPPPPALDNATLFALDDETASLEQRVKSYLHTNCSQCHQPGGTGEGNIDLRFETSLAQMGICDVIPSDAGGNPSARYIAPGSPADSTVLIRMQSDVASGLRMPPLATSVVDVEAVAVFTGWINGLTDCP